MALKTFVVGLGNRFKPESNGSLSRARLLEIAVRTDLMRTLYWSFRFRGPVVLAKGSRIRAAGSAKMTFKSNGMLFMGFAQFNPSGAYMHLGLDAHVHITGTVQLLRGSRTFVSDNASLSIGTRTYLGDYSTLTCLGRTTIGAGCAISWQCNLLDSNAHELDVDGRLINRIGELWIGDNVWIGTGSILLPSVRIGNGAVIGAGAVVTGSVEPNTLVGGNPARLIHTTVEWRQ